MSQLTIISRHSPYASIAARETLDVALASAAFDVKVCLIFLGDGLFQLLKGQNTEALGLKNLSSNLQALEIFGIDKVYALDSDLAARRLTPEQLCIPVEVLDAKTLSEKLHNPGQILCL